MGTYLEDNPPKIRQFRSPRRATVTGLIVVHTAESVMDTVGPDTGAENVAAFIRNRSDYGSYHTLVDSDSVVRLVPFSAEAYGDGTGSNLYAIHISFACSAADWAKMSKAKQDAFLRNGAKAAAEAARWVKDQRGIKVPAVRVSKAASAKGAAGFISHGERDPGRRTDPGALFPWQRFLQMYLEEMEGKPVAAPKPTKPLSVRKTIATVTAEIQRLRAARKRAKKRGEPVPPYTQVIKHLKDARARAKKI